MTVIQTNRLSLYPLTESSLQPFTLMIQDPYILKYLMDGETESEEWCLNQIHESNGLFQSHQVGLWMIHLRECDTPIGFCGFLMFPELFAEPQLTYALYEQYAGNGYVKEAVEAVIEHAFYTANMPVIYSAADEPNIRSINTLESMNFIRTGETPGVFGKIWLYQLKR